MSTVVAVATEENGSGSEGLEGWRSALAKQVGLPGQVFSSLRDGEVVKKLFEGCISPGLRVGPDGTTVDIPDDYSIKICGCNKLYKMFFEKDLFKSLPVRIQKCTLDLLCFTLRRSVHDVARFRFVEKKFKKGIIEILLEYLCEVLQTDKKELSRDEILITKRIIRLIGVVAVSGITTPELKRFLSLLRLPSLFSISLLQALKSMLMVNDSIVKAYPLSFFDFCDIKSGMSITPFSFPFTKEYQVSFWFRVENFAGDSPKQNQNLFTYMNNCNGLKVFLEDDVLCVSVSNGPAETTVIKCSDNEISPRVWYNICITHVKPRMTLFAKYEMSITLDGKQVFQGIVRFPSASTIDTMTNASVGNNFDGQIGPVYIFNEVIPVSSIDMIARRDAGKPTKEALKKSVTTKVLSVYHPQRFDGRQVVDYHGNHHAVLCDDAFVCNMVPVRETLTSLGGVACLLPLFPTLLVENEELRVELLSQTASCPMTCGWEVHNSELRRKNNSYTPTNIGLGTSLYDIMTDDDLPMMFGSESVLKLDSTDIFELQDDKPIGLLVFIIARCLREHRTHQGTLLDIGGVQMISYCLSRLSAESKILKQEDESLILALLQLREAVVNHPELEVLVLRELICNISIWSSASYKLQTSLYSVILANIKAQTDFFEDVFGVQNIIDYLNEYYLHVVDRTVIETNTLVYVSTSPSEGGEGIVQKVGDPSPPRTPPRPGQRKPKSKSFTTEISTKWVPATELTCDPTTESDRCRTPSPINQVTDSGPQTDSTPQSNAKPKRRGSGTKTFLRSVSRRMSATESTTPPPETLSVNSHHRPFRFGDMNDDSSGRTMSVKFADTTSSKPRRRFSLGSLANVSHEDAGECPADESDKCDEVEYGNGSSVTKLSCDQRKAIRSIFESMIVVLSIHRCSVNEIEPLFFFLQDCEDNVVLDEIAQIILCIVVGDTSLRIVTTMMELFKGPEDLLAFLLNRLDHRPCESLRNSFFALILHCYLRVDSISSSLVNSSASKVKKSSKLMKARERFSSVGDGHALQRLDACGGLASVCMLLNENKKDCGLDTYNSLFSLLFATRTSNIHISPYFKKLYKECVSTTHSLSGDFHLDESQEILNPTMLVSYFYFVPKLPMSVQESVHRDLLAILKHNHANREVFRSNTSWHLCMYDLVGQLIVLKTGEPSVMLKASEVMGFLEEWALFQRPHKEDALAELFLPKLQCPESTNHMELPGSPSRRSQLHRAGSNQGSNIDGKKVDTAPDARRLELWFDIGMKTYATMLVHSMDMSGGFIEIQRTASQSFESVQGTSVTLSIFSHLLHELTFTVQSKYKDMQRMARSTNGDEVIQATNKLQNMLSIIILLSLYLYEKDSIALLGVPDVSVARRRWKVLKDMRKNQQDKPVCNSSCSSETHWELCSVASDKCNLCGHSLSLHKVEKKSMMELVEEQVIAEISSGTGMNVAHDETEEPVHVAHHQWMDLRSRVGYPPEVNKSPLRQTSKSKNLFSGETLNPLERGYEMKRGKMVVSLQVLRYFDVIFWPEENRLRNSHLLNVDIPPSKGSPRKGTKLPVAPSMTMYSSVLRASLFVFHGLSPFTEFAELNVRRLEQLLKIIEQVPNSCPTHDWTMVILAHLTLALQRVYSSIESCYGMLGIDSYFSTAESTGNANSAGDVFGDHAVTEKINNLFNHPAGKQLVQYINSCITFLVSIYSTRKEFLSSRLDDNAFMALTLLVQNTQNYQFHVQSVKEKFTFLSKPAAGNYGEPKRNFSDDMDDSGGSYNASPNNRRSPFHTSSGNFTFSKSRSNISSHFSTDGSDHESDEKVCEDTLYALFFLRDPFFKLDVVKCESMLEAFFSLESFEKDCSASYLNEMVKLQDELMVKRNLIGNCIDEIDELTMLGKDVKQSLIAKISTRRTNKSVRLEIRTKTCATFWNNCLRMFEESWSPWSSELEGGENMVGYTASVHRDSSMRRMVMFRNDEHVDYSDAAYFEGKLRDQQDFDGVVNDDSYEEDISKGNVSNPSSTLSFMKDTLQLTRPKASKLNTTDSAANDNSDDDNDSTEDAEETTIDIKRNENIFSAVLNNNIEKRPLWALTFAWHPDEREIFSAEVMEIMTEQVLAGTVLLTNRNIYFHPKKRAGGFLVKPDEFRNKRWQLSKMTECYGRRYLLQNCGIELFFMDSPELFFAFNTHKESNRFFRYLKKQSLQSLTMPLSLSPSYIFQHSNWTELWKKRAISNFEYIMRLNIIAGRSYNDITQYPVFPWVLCDYESETIDLNDPAVYRDLSKPIGALNPERLVEILDRYKSFGEMDMPQFMYGSHYSSAGLILHFMIRQEPFTSMAITLQGGRFDCPDRLFFNIKETWKCCNTSMSDVKELVPQMFYFPEAFVNSNSLPLGDLQDERGAVDKVVLPPWCNDDPFEFVRIHREALESEFVSQHLHEWIDLIFGFKQTGQAAVEANNVFHYLTYENAIDIEAITDPLQRAAAKAQVTHFGQTPSQIMTKEHPKRNDIDDCIISFCAFPTTTCLDRFQCYLHPKQCGMNNEHGAVVSINCSSNLLVVFYADFTVGYHKWSTVPETNKTPFSLKFDKSRVIPNCNSSIFYHHIPAKEDADIIEKISPIRSRASSVGEGLLAARNNLFKRTLFPQGDKSRTLSMESVVTASTIANISNETSKKNDEFGKDGGVDCDEEEDDDISRSESSFGSSTIKKTEYSSHTPFSDDSFADDTSIDTRPSLDDNFSFSKIKNKHVAFKMGEGSNGFVLSCGYWNNAMKVHSLKDSLVEVMCKSGGHHGQITCLDVGSNQHILVTGGQDGTCRVWHINGSVDLCLERQHVLLGHTDPLTAIAYSCHHDLVLSASRNGFLCLHTAQRGRFIRSISTLSTTHSHPVDQVAISSAGYLITHSSIDCCMNVFWINGQHLKRIVLESSVECMTFNKEGSVLFCGLTSGVVAVLRSWDLERICSIDLPEYGSITCLKLIADDQYLLIGSEKGAVHIGTDPETRWKVLHSVISMNPLMSSAL